MEIRNKKIKDMIMPLFESQGVVKTEGNNLDAYLKVLPDKTYIKLYYNEHKIVLSEKYADKDYWTIKGYLESELKHNPEKNMKDYTLDDLKNLSDEIKEEMKHIWFAADYHQGHKPMAESLWDGIDRPTNTETHDDWLVSITNNRVNKNDKFFILGDLSLAPRIVAEKFIKRLNGNKVLIFGNHDKNLHNTTVISEKTIRKEFKFKRPGIDLFIVLDHYPMASWNRSVHGSWHLYGHVHGRFKSERLAMDVGIDNEEMNHAPINLWEVAHWMIKRRIEISNLQGG